MKITVVKKAASKTVRAACPWVIEDWSDAKKK
jgi:hypothetical protein